MLDGAAIEGMSIDLINAPSSLLKAELLRRQTSTERPQCGSEGVKQEYNTPLHVFALFLILILSTLACSFPIFVRRVPRIPIPHHFLFLSRHFGTGVLIATAFVHLLPTAFVSLTDPCLPPFWNQGYPAMAGFIAMISVMVVVGVEMFFATKGAAHSHSSDFEASNGTTSKASKTEGQNGHVRPNNTRTGSYRPFKGSQMVDQDQAQDDFVLEDASDWRKNGKRTDSQDHETPDEDSNADLDSDGEADESQHLNSRRRPSTGHTGHDDVNKSSHSSNMTEYQQQQKMLLQCLLLEAGILFHSVFIGMAVSVATGTSFIVLLVAISFHQTFEGLALGSRISAITAFPRNSPKPWLMALAYGTTTPAGQAIGLLIHELYDPYSQTGLLMVGVMNAISSGLLLFAGLVELLAEDFLSDHSYDVLKGQKRLQACAAVVSGSMLMALVGAWA